MRKLLLTAVAVLTAAMCANAGTKTPKRELRSTWFTTHVNIDWPLERGTSATVIASQKSSLQTYLDQFEKMHLNGICFHVRALSDACYKSSYEPWSAVMSGTRGVDPGWDPLSFAVEECHKRGLECWAWINPYRWSTGTDYNTAFDKEFKEKGWILTYNKYSVLNPALPEVREHILKVCKEIVDNYAIDGVLFDDYFYPNNIPENSTAGDWEQYKASNSNLSIGDWRRENVNIFVRAFRDMVETEHPDMRFGISPAGVAGDANTSAGKFGVDPNPVSASDWQYGTIYSDPLAWLNDGSIDFISPQIYWTTSHATAPYEPLCEWWNYIADHFGRHFYSSHSVSLLASNNTSANWAEIATQVRLNRKYDTKSAPGSIYFSSKYFYGPTATGLGDHLLQNTYQTLALTPVVPWKKVPALGTPADLSFDGTTLKWKAVSADKINVRYTIYAVPMSVSMDDAMEANGDGISNDYLLKVSYTPSFTVPADRRTDYWYAVCAYDGAGNEYDPAVVGYPSGVSAIVTLTAPADGANVDWTTTLEWSSVAGAQYQVRIAKDADFSNIVYTSDRISQSSLTVDLDEFSPGVKHYWCVRCFEPNKLVSTSATRSFVTPTYTDAPATTLVSPADDAHIEDGVELKWTEVSGVTSYKVQIAADATFNDIRHEATYGVGVTLTRVNASLIGLGTFHWRVVTEGPHLNPTASESRTLTVDRLSTGLTEPGYEIKKDPATYPSVNNVTVENLWVRSVKTDFDNIRFENDGMLDRSMVAVNNYVYLTHRSENSEGALLSLEKYDGFTGEHIASIDLGSEGNLPYFPLNTVTADDAGNIVISNMVLNAMKTPLILHSVNLADGSLTQIANISLSGLSTGRVDHVNVKGNVATGNFSVIFAVASNAYLVRATYVNGKQTDLKVSTATQFVPSSRTSFGIAPAVTPVTDTEVLVNGGGTAMGRYNITNGRLVDSFGNGTLSDVATSANGSEYFKLGYAYYMVYPAGDYNDDKGFTFNIVRGNDDSFAGMSHIATVPADGLGAINSSTASTPISAVVDADGTARVYVYAVGNGLAAYRISDPESGISTDISSAGVANGNLTVSTDNRDIVLSRAADNVDVYTTTGALVAARRGVDRVSIDNPGMYIVVADGIMARVILN